MGKDNEESRDCAGLFLDLCKNYQKKNVITVLKIKTWTKRSNRNSE